MNIQQDFLKIVIVLIALIAFGSAAFFYLSAPKDPQAVIQDSDNSHIEKETDSNEPTPTPISAIASSSTDVNKKQEKSTNPGTTTAKATNTMPVATSTPVKKTTETKPLSGDKEKAKVFALSVVKTYFDKNCDAFYDSLADTLYTLEGEGPIEKDSIPKATLCDGLTRAINGTHTYEEYLDSYKIEILSKSEYEARYPSIKDLKNFTPTTSDYLFLGHEEHAGIENFVWDDMFLFMVRKDGSNFELIAASG